MSQFTGAAIHPAPPTAQDRRPFGLPAHPVPSGSARDSWSLPSEDLSVPQARRLTRSQLQGWGLAEQSETAELLVSELVTNSVRHAHGRLQMSICRREGTLRVEIEDADHARPQVRHADDDDESGRGLQLVELLSSGWGCDQTPTGKVVWFELPL